MISVNLIRSMLCFSLSKGLLVDANLKTAFGGFEVPAMDSSRLDELVNGAEIIA